MKILFDTSFIIWIFNKPAKFSKRTARELDSGEIYFSSISLMEIAIKKSINKLPMQKTSLEIYKIGLDNGWIFLPFEPEDVARLEKIPVLHSDPFDRMIISQAIHHNMTIATTDKQFEQYNVKVLS